MGLIQDMAAKQGAPVGKKLPVPTRAGDDTLIAAKTGEYVLPPEVVAAIGVDKLNALVESITGQPPGGQPAEMPQMDGQPMMGEQMMGHAKGGLISRMQGYAAGGYIESAQDIANRMAKANPNPTPTAATAGATPAPAVNYDVPPSMRSSVSSATMDEFNAAQRAAAGASSPPPSQSAPAAPAAATPKPGLASRAVNALTPSRATTAGALAGAGIAGAGQAISDLGTGYRDEFNRSVGAESPMGTVAADAARTLAAVGDAATFGLAGRVGRGIASATGGGSFSEGFASPSDREKFLAAKGPTLSSLIVPAASVVPTAQAAEPQSKPAAQSSAQPTATQPAPTGLAGRAGADVLRDVWQANPSASKGLQGANADTLAIYNGEQQQRNSGISAQRQPNGVMAFTGKPGGTGDTGGTVSTVPTGAGLASMARANAIRQSTIDSLAGGRQGPGGGVIGNGMMSQSNPSQDALKQAMALANDPKATNGQRQTALGVAQELTNSALKRDELSQRVQEAGDRQSLGLQQLDANQSLGLAQLAQRQQEAERTGALHDVQRQGAQFDLSQKQAVADLERKALGGDAQAMARLNLLRSNGKSDDSRQRLVTDLIKSYSSGTTLPNMPLKDYVNQGLELATGTVQSSSSAPSFDQYAAQIRAKNPGANVTDVQLQAAYKQQFQKGQ